MSQTLRCDLCDRPVEYGCGQTLPENVVCEDCVRRLVERGRFTARQRVKTDGPVVQEFTALKGGGS